MSSPPVSFTSKSLLDNNKLSLQESQNPTEQTEPIQSGRFHCHTLECRDHGGKGYHDKDPLKEYLDTAHFDTKFDCTISGCTNHGGRGFRHKYNLDRHLRRSHGITSSLFTTLGNPGANVIPSNQKDTRDITSPTDSAHQAFVTEKESSDKAIRLRPRTTTLRENLSSNEEMQEASEGCGADIDSEYEKAHEQWLTEYDRWKDMTCACGAGYFTIHAEWIPGVEVRAGRAPPKPTSPPSTVSIREVLATS